MTINAGISALLIPAIKRSINIQLYYNSRKMNIVVFLLQDQDASDVFLLYPHPDLCILHFFQQPSSLKFQKIYIEIFGRSSSAYIFDIIIFFSHFATMFMTWG